MHGSERAYPTHDQLKHARESIALGSPPSAPMTPTPPPVAYSSPPTVPRVAVSFEYFKLGSAPKSKRSWTKRWAPMNVVSSRGDRYFEFFQHQVGVCASSQRCFDAVFKSSLDCSHERRISKPARHNFCVIAEIASKTNRILFRCKEDVALRLPLRVLCPQQWRWVLFRLRAM